MMIGQELTKTTRIGTRVSNETITTYNDQAKILSSVTIPSPTIGDKFVINYTYDADGRILTRREENTRDGVVNFIEEIKNYEYDENGNVIFFDIFQDYTADGTFDFRQNFTRSYNEFNQLLSNLRSDNNNQPLDDEYNFLWEYIYTYDDNNLLLSETSNRDINADGMVDFLETTVNTYYDFGQLNTQEFTTTEFSGFANNKKVFDYAQTVTDGLRIAFGENIASIL